MSEWQKCPVCDGQGHVGKPPYVSGDQQTWVSNKTSHTCHVCGGKGIILTPQKQVRE